jgi:hypothetical protein
VLSTPTIGTGVSIDLRGHFKAVFGIFQGVTPDSESRQALARVRESVPRFVWAAHFSPSKVGNGSCNYRDVARSATKSVRSNISLLKEVDFDLDTQSDPIALRTWAKMSARVNASLWNYRKELRNGLSIEGHQVTIVTDDLTKLFGQTHITHEMVHSLADGSLQVSGFEFLGWQHDAEGIDRVIQSIAKIRTQNQNAEAIAISDSPEISSTEYKKIKDQTIQTARKRNSKRKHELQCRYPVEITPEVKLKDDGGWYAQLRLHYYLEHDPELVKLHDMQELQGHLDRGDGKILVQDVRLLTAQVEALRSLKILDLLKPGEPIRATDPEIQHVITLATHYKEDIKALFNLTITDKVAPMAIVQSILNKIGIKLTCTGRDRAPDGRRGGIRVYKYYAPTDDRETIFAEWEKSDMAMLQTLMEVSGCDSFSEIDEWIQLSA